MRLLQLFNVYINKLTTFFLKTVKIFLHNLNLRNLLKCILDYKMMYHRYKSIEFFLQKK